VTRSTPAPSGSSGPQDVTIVGAGLVGALAAIVLARRGLAVEVYERRPDLRRAGAAGGRSINLVLTARGLRALETVGLAAGALELSVPVLGRMIHGVDGRQAFQPYGRDASECNHSISRGALNRFLVERAEASGVQLRFEHALESADLDTGRLTFDDVAASRRVEVETRTAIGADGAGSALRAALSRRPGFDESVELLSHGYKELTIPAGPGGTWRVEKRALHVWPRGEVMLMALPNLDGSFTVTLYLPVRGMHSSFEVLQSKTAVRDFFARQFPDAVPLIPDLDEEFFANPTGELGTVRCAPWHAGSRALLLGDAAHAIVPFFGQGMNCGFEDCGVLDERIERRGFERRAELFAEFEALRKPNADAIAEMALDNFVEMRDRVADARFLLRKAVEHRLEVEFPREYRSRYSMVMYSSIPYAVAQGAGRIQDGILAQACAGLRTADELDLGRVRALVRERLAPYLAAHAASLDY